MLSVVAFANNAVIMPLIIDGPSFNNRFRPVLHENCNGFYSFQTGIQFRLVEN